MDINQVTEQIIGCAYTVSNTLGTGFLEKVYENALAIELRNSGLPTSQQMSIQVTYQGVVVGDFFADLVVSNCVIIELKAAKALDANHVACCMNYLKATGYKICLLINFGNPKIEIKRLIL